MKAPQIIMIIILAVNLYRHLDRHGESRFDNYNFPAALIATLIYASLLWWGGFFS